MKLARQCIVCKRQTDRERDRERERERERERDRGEGSTVAADLVFKHLHSEAVYIEPQSDLRFTGAHVAPRVWRVQCTRHQQLLACVCVSV